ncbi:glycosyltransferase [Paenibacillus wynnii]|uniref:glycosyltransferase n=1 Tax=Paenibacillus wynnii TaxID=268407 RepID=UPI00279233C3|nr:glycosyltransferase [Paenibacillus wynnii]MDQ0194843.1 glycosyltransferase involved in cell wall biosynthesis [Paenibacillus wynnii]
MSISLCMITKNEERFLMDCLNSVKDAIDEIIIVDTGSTDRTCEIALSFGAKIYHRPWEQDFAAPRNFGIDRAKGQWILILDADETLEASVTIRQMVTDAEKDIEGFLMNICNYSDDAKSLIEQSVGLRLFRNQPRFRYFGALHEQLPLQDANVALSGLIIHHFGYMPSVTLAKEKHIRNLEILMKEKVKNPNSAFVYYNLGTEYVRLKQYSTALKHYTTSLDLLDQETGYEARMYKLMTLCYLHLEPNPKHLSTLQQGVQYFPDYPDLYYMRGLYFEKLGIYPQAVADFIHCLVMDHRLENVPDIYVKEEGITSYKAYFALGRVYEKLGKHQEAFTAYGRSLRCKPLYPEVMQVIQQRFSKELSQLIRFLEEHVFLGAENEQLRFQYAKHYYELGTYSTVVSLLDHFTDPLWADQTDWIRGICYYHLDHWEQAAPLLANVPLNHPHYVEASAYLMAMLWAEEHTEPAKKMLDALDDPGPSLLKLIEIRISERELTIRGGLEQYPESTRLKQVPHYG